jgi:hypothetical protein
MKYYLQLSPHHIVEIFAVGSACVDEDFAVLLDHGVVEIAVVR